MTRSEEIVVRKKIFNLQYRGYLEKEYMVLINTYYTWIITSFGVQVTARRPLRSCAAWTTGTIPRVEGQTTKRLVCPAVPR